MLRRYAFSGIIGIIIFSAMACDKGQDDPATPDPREQVIGAYAGIWSDRLDTVTSAYPDTFFVTAEGSDSIRITNEAFAPIYRPGAPVRYSGRFLYDGSTNTFYWGIPSNYEATYCFFSTQTDSMFYSSHYQSPMSPHTWHGGFSGGKIQVP